jgi:hypothetical protein
MAVFDKGEFTVFMRTQDFDTYWAARLLRAASVRPVEKVPVSKKPIKKL